MNRDPPGNRKKEPSWQQGSLPVTSSGAGTAEERQALLNPIVEKVRKRVKALSETVAQGR